MPVESPVLTGGLICISRMCIALLQTRWANSLAVFAVSFELEVALVVCVVRPVSRQTERLPFLPSFP